MTPALEAQWRTLFEGVYPQIRGKLVPADVFDEVQRLLKEYRK
jgi:TRAP-type transport system periplasmic protein